MIVFETEVCRSWFGRPKLVIRSSHEVVNGKLINIFQGLGRPMLDVGDAIELRAVLDRFISEESKAR